ncbi:MAG: phosphoribosyltransferase [Nanoarchaeota archaeon]|nr:phosphoribosyltransferase [Nanoarchaeota archaeon]MBU1623236.1 phosphoribosyltransferase [Nanoarchaeota archaeon]
MIFKDRFAAGKLLAEKLIEHKSKENTLILAIPRGGLETGFSLAKELNLPLDVVLTKKIGFPGNPEYAIGAVSLKSEIIFESLITTGQVSRQYIDEEIKKIRKKLKMKYYHYRENRDPLDLKNKLVILTDDGAATGRTLLAAIKLVKQEKVKKIIVAIPVSHPETVKKLKEKAEVVCLETPRDFFAVGQFYEHFNQVNDKEAIKLLKEANKNN